MALGLHCIAAENLYDRLRAGPQSKFGHSKEPINNIGIALDPVVDEGGFTF